MKLFPCVVLKNGAEVSIQASSFHYCAPRRDTKDYIAVEVSINNDPNVPEYLQEFFDDFVYPFVPVEIVERYISEVGIDIGKTLGRFRTFHVPGDL